MVDMVRYLTIGHLVKRLREAGISDFPITWINRKQKQGLLSLRTIPNNYKGRRVVTDSDITEIIKAFSSGGQGYWHFTGITNEITPSNHQVSA